MLRRLLLSLLFLSVVAGVSRAGDSVSVKIKQLGLEGIYPTNGTSTIVEVEARNVSDRPLTLKLSVAELNLEQDARPASETYVLPLKLAPGETHTVNVPLHIFPVNRAVVFVDARDMQDHVLDQTARRVGERTQGLVLALLCATPELCRSIQQSILLSGSPEEQTHKAQYVHMIQLSEAPSTGWVYSPAHTAIVASSIEKMSAAQREALELFVHRGGTLVLAEDQLADGPPLWPPAAGSANQTNSQDSNAFRFLGSYRARAAEGKTYPVGAGGLVHFRSVSSQAFANYFRPLGFSENTPTQIREEWERFRAGDSAGTPSDETSWLMSRLGTSFRFPTFLELLLWIVGYLVLVGGVNFIILRRINRSEWGWITIPAISVLFSLLLYIVSAWNHPRNFGLDEMAEYHMDGLSPFAVLQSKVRISAPIRSESELELPPDLIYEYVARPFLSDVGFVPQGSQQPIREIRLGKTWDANLKLRRWSFQDLDFAGHRRFAGTVFRDSVSRLHNDSGVNYREAIAVDHEDVYLLGEFPAGAVVDLGHVKRLPYEKETGRVLSGNQSYPGPPFSFRLTEGGWSSTEEQLRRYAQEWKTLPNQPFSLLELIRSWSPKGDDVFHGTQAVFFGLSTEATLGATLQARSPSHTAYSLMIVTFKDWP
jgi:hypothetical protein